MIIRKREESKFDRIGFYISLILSTAVLFSFLVLPIPIFYFDIGMNDVFSRFGIDIVRTELAILLIISYAISLVFHETGHYLCNKIYGLDSKFSYEFNTSTLKVKTVAVDMKENLTLNDKQMIITSFSGPFFNILLLMISIVLLFISSGQLMSLFIACLIISNYLQAVINLTPIIHGTDGHSILAHYLKMKGYYENKDFYKEIKNELGITKVKKS